VAAAQHVLAVGHHRFPRASHREVLGQSGVREDCHELRTPCPDLLDEGRQLREPRREVQNDGERGGLSSGSSSLSLMTATAPDEER